MGKANQFQFNAMVPTGGSSSKRIVGFHRICPACKKREIKNYYAQRCKPCAFADRKTSHNPNWRGGHACKQCGIKQDCKGKSGLCMNCYLKKNGYCGLPKCKKCNSNLSRHDLKYKGTGYCRKCYRGSVTRRWNHTLTMAERGKSRTKQPAYVQWRWRVFERDIFTCQLCGEKKIRNNLVAHHLYSYGSFPDLRWTDNNGITICRKCHDQFHFVFGNTANTAEQFNKFVSLEF